MTRRVRLPLDEKARRAADVATGRMLYGKVQVTDAAQHRHIREIWMDAYAANGGEIIAAQSSSRKVRQIYEPCAPRRIELRYLYADATPVAGALYRIESYDGAMLYQGKLDPAGYACIDNIPDDVGGFRYSFHADPASFVIHKQPLQKPDPESTHSALEEMIDWVWGVIQGDFNDNASNSQVVANMLLGLIPFVDQALDVRDIIACLKKLIDFYGESESERIRHPATLGLSHELWIWLELLITAIGCIPEVGSAVKGVLKILINFLVDIGKRAGNMDIALIQRLWQRILAVLNDIGVGNTSRWLEQFPENLDGWMKEAVVRIRHVVDACQQRLDFIEKWLRRTLGSKDYLEAKQRIDSIRHGFRLIVENMDRASNAVGNWLKEQMNHVLKGKNHFLMSGAPGTAHNPVVNTRVQEAVPPPSLPELPPKRGGRRDALVPGSPEHKADRWKRYQERTGGKGQDYEQWSKTYDQNMLRAKRANAAADAYHQQMGWGTREVTVEVDGQPRRLDIADVAEARGVEFKTGYQTANAENLSELARDKKLVESGWSIEWVFQGRASEPLKQALRDANIPFREIGGGVK